MQTPEISVIIPVYKAQDFLRRCLDSLTAQTYPHLQIILVDDGSPDQSGAICEEYAARDGRFLVLHTENRGAYAARNTGLDAARGELIGFVDADDWVDPDLYAVLLELLLRTGADVAQCEAENDGPYAQMRGVALGEERVYTREELTPALFREEISHCLWTKLYRARVWRELRFPEEYYHSDAVVLSELDAHCTSLARTDTVLYHYNTTNQSITRGRKRMLHLYSLQRLFDAYDRASVRAGDAGDFFLCREIPSYGRLLLPSPEIKRRQVRTHRRYMHGIFVRHWAGAKASAQYRRTGMAKKLLWHIYRYLPGLEALLIGLYGGLREKCRFT